MAQSYPTLIPGLRSLFDPDQRPRLFRTPGRPPPARDAAVAQIESEAVMDIGVFQLLPRGRAATDREVVEQALWEVDFAERHGFESVCVTEHHFSGYGSIGVPSVYAAGTRVCVDQCSSWRTT